MTIPNGYVTRQAFKSALKITDTADDVLIDRAIRDASRWIDNYCGRHFYVVNETRYFAYTANGLLIDDLVAITSLKTDADGDAVYENTWAATDYSLRPRNALRQSPPRPYREIATTPNGVYSFSSALDGNQITGRWGFYEVLEVSSATLAEALDTTETGVDVSAGTAFDVGHILKIEDEQMLVTAISSNTLTVTRGYNGTTAAIHGSGLAISVYTFPIIETACLIQAARYFQRPAALFGVSGSGDFGQGGIVSKFDPDVWQFLQTNRILAVA